MSGIRQEEIEMAAQEVRSTILRMQRLLGTYPDLCEPEIEDMLVFGDILRTAAVRAARSNRKAA
jgi:hypothetical protein